MMEMQAFCHSAFILWGALISFTPYYIGMKCYFCVYILSQNQLINCIFVTLCEYKVIKMFCNKSEIAH